MCIPPLQVVNKIGVVLYKVLNVLRRADCGINIMKNTFLNWWIKSLQDFFGRPAFLTVSGQLNAEIYATALCDVRHYAIAKSQSSDYHIVIDQYHPVLSKFY